MSKESPQQEPIAIIGIGCRFPGDSTSPDAYWKMMCAGTDTITEIPPDRWNTKAYYDPVPQRPGKSITKWGGFIKDVDKFDPEVFSISPREADWMDPQQRLLLEASWEALEDGGQNIDRLRGSPTGVFLGISTTDYFFLQYSLGERPRTDVYTATGGTISIAANRISYAFDFQGPSMAMDTACSSALTAVHVACLSLWKGECTMAIAAGVNAILSPFAYMAFSRMGMLSPTGRCQAFDAAANGFVRSEGVGSILLKPLSSAIAAGDKIYCVIRATAANQDGRTNGITVPSPIAQEALVRAACRSAGILPHEVKYMEAHGTGTPVGDPIEAHALGSALGEGRSENEPCIVGSVKTNIGHLEAAAGIAGIIKVALVLKHGAIPPNIHFNKPNPYIDFAKLKLRVIQKMEPFPSDGPMLAGINSFGFGGANAHAILEGPPASKPKKISRNGKPGPKTLILPLSARTTPALQALAKNYQALLAGDADLHSICAASARRRTHHSNRLYLIGDSRKEMQEKLAAFLAGDGATGLIHGNVSAEPQTAPVFVFSGQGPQWWGMGRQLLKSEPLFREKIEECDRYFSEFGDWSLLEELRRDENSTKLDDTAIAQPAIFAIQVALAALWQSWGVKPSSVIGHSVGEVAAAHVAGILTLHEAARVIFHRGDCMEHAHSHGRMLAAGLDPKQAEELIAKHPGKINIAAFNSPVSVTLTGDSAALEEISKSLEKRNIFNRFLQVKYAFHSNQMDPAKQELLAALGKIELAKPAIPMISTVTGLPVTGLDLTAEYWWHNVREPVRFSEAMSHLIGKAGENGSRVFLELSAHPALVVSMNECLVNNSTAGTVLASLRREGKDRLNLLETFSGLHLAGVSVDWSALYPEVSAEVALPKYPWQRERYWQEPPSSREARLSDPQHPLLLRNLQSSNPTWVSWLDQDSMPWLKDHRVQTHIVFPGAGYVETALGMGRTLLGNGPISIEDLDLQKALFLPDNKDIVYLQSSYNPTDLSLKFSSRTEQAGNEWTTNVVGKLQAIPQAVPNPALDLDAIRKRCDKRTLKPDEIYAMYESIGFSYGPLFKGLEEVWRRDGECLGRIRLPEGLMPTINDYQMHPVLLDCCFHTYTFSVPVKNPLAVTLLLPVSIERIKYFAKPGAVIWCYAKLVRIGSRFAMWDFQILDEAGKVVMEIENFRSQAMAGTVTSRSDSPQNWVYEQEWRRKPLGQSVLFREPASYIGETWQLAGEAAQAVQNRLPKTPASVSAEKLSSGLNALARLYLVQALSKKVKIAPAQRKYWSHMLELLESKTLPAAREPGVLWSKLLRQFPAAYPELTLMLRCGQSLGQILSGKLDAPSQLSPGGSTTILEHLYQDSPSHQSANYAVAETIAAAIKDRPRDRVIRILEIGGGTGGLTSYILPKLIPERTDYIFSDANEALLTKAEQKFFDSAFVKCQKFDLDIPPQEQTLDLASFDIIIVSDALRSSANPRLALSHINRLLAPNGLLLLCERIHTPAWFEFVFGPTGQWKQPPIDRDQLLKWLAETQFDHAAPLAAPAEVSASGLGLILARSSVASKDSAAPLPPNPKPGAWLIFADRTGFASELSQLMIKRGDHPILVNQGSAFRRVAQDQYEASTSSADLVALLTEVSAKPVRPIAGIIHLRSLDFAAGDSLDVAKLAEAEVEGCHGLLALIQSLPKITAIKNPRLWLVTRGAQAIYADEAVAVAQGPAVGMGRAILSEYRHVRCCLVDLTPGGAPTDAQFLLHQIASDDNETEVAFRGIARHVGRVVRTGLDQHVPQPKTALPYRLEIIAPGVLDELRFRELPRRKPGPEEIEVEICAAAMNFRDVMKALGIYPMESDYDLLLGDECSGRVVAVGRKVKDFKIGDEVIASGLGCFASHLTIPSLCAIKKPSRITFEEAVTIPVTFMTAWYALHQLGHIKKGEKILVQAGTGGVGLAAIQIAQLAGAEIFATAGNPEKREFLRAMGVAHALDSRTLAFADEIRRITNGRGVDLVLNSLSGHAIAKGLSVLAPQGRYLEIGKRDIYGDTHIGLRPFRNNLSMFVIDMAQVILCEPTRIRSLFKPIIDLIQAGKLNPLPHRALPASKAITAFRLMAQARHIGKIVLSMQKDTVTARRVIKRDFIKFPAKASYLITGGLGGFGLYVAKWMIENGARHLVLSGRSGAAKPEAKRAVAELKRLGATVTVVKSDVTKKEDVDRLFKLIARSCPPLRGIFHTAAVIDDGILAQLTPERFVPVMAPKVAGTWNLHQASLDLKLDYFVMFSSISSLVGAAGQGNYVCANSFLDSMAHYRRSLGLSALTINWGAIAEVGFISRNANVEQHLTSHGVIGIAPKLATATLGRLLQSDATQIAFMHVDWQKYAGSNQSAAIPPRYSELIQASGQENTDGAAEIRKAILAAPPAKRLALVAAQIREPVAKVLRTSAAKLDIDRPLKEMGLDSLMAVELLNRIEVRFGVSLPPGKLSTGGGGAGSGAGTIMTIAGIVLELIAGDSAGAATAESEVQKSELTVDQLDLPFERVHVFRAEGSRPPVFCIHPAGGFTALYDHLVEQLPSDIPIYGIQSRAYHDKAGEHTTIDSMAREYAALIMERQPEGPCRLVGFSLGGFFALATARQLEKQGRTVTLVGMIDTPLAMLEKTVRQELVLGELVAEIYDYFSNQLSMVPPVDSAELSAAVAALVLKLQAADEEDRSKIIMAWMTERGFEMSGGTDNIAKQFVTVAIQHAELVKTFKTGAIQAPVCLWNAGHSDLKTLHAHSDGTRFTAATFSEASLNGRHFELLHPPLVEQLAERLNTALQETETSESPAPVEVMAK